jgi:hypothetical protein
MYLQLAFFKGLSKDEGIMTSLSRILSGKYIHVVLIFIMNDGSYYVSDVRSDNNKVTYRKEKSFKREGWVMVTLTLPLQQVELINKYCKSAAKRECTYNFNGRLWFATPFGSNGNEKCYTCSELVIYAFQSANLMNDLISENSSIEDIYQSLEGYNGCIMATPNKSRYKGKVTIESGSIEYDDNYRTKSVSQEIKDAFDSFV